MGVLQKSSSALNTSGRTGSRPCSQGIRLASASARNLYFKQLENAQRDRIERFKSLSRFLELAAIWAEAAAYSSARKWLAPVATRLGPKVDTLDLT